jgi:hypothetical protein
VSAPLINLTIEDRSIRVVLSERDNVMFELQDVLFGPFDLDPMAGRPISHEGR